MSTRTAPQIETPSYSFYVDAGKADLIEEATKVADAVTVRGSDGPRVVEGLRRSGWESEVLFDHAAYARPEQEVNVRAWFEQQYRAGAHRLLSPGLWVDFSEDSSVFEQELELEVQRVDAAEGAGSTLVVAMDHRWLTRHTDTTASVLADLDRPVALVLGSSADPLSAGGAVDGLINVAKASRQLTLMRIDHGGVGGVAFGAAHSSFGLRPVNRHVVPPGKRAFGKPNDRSARLFVKDKLDWFTAMTVAGWATVEVPENCDLVCCEGEPLSRFLDARLASQVDYHNMVALAEVASYIVNAGQHERRRLFAELCQRAVNNYDRLGSMGIEPKPQLQAWALWA